MRFSLEARENVRISPLVRSGVFWWEVWPWLGIPGKSALAPFFQTRNILAGGGVTSSF